MPGGDRNSDNAQYNSGASGDWMPSSFGNAIGAYSREKFATILDRQAPTRVRSALAGGQIPQFNRAQAQEWLEAKERELAAPTLEHESALRHREVEAAEKSAAAAETAVEYARTSAESARDAADSARSSVSEAQRYNRISMFGAVLAFFAFIISVASFFKK